MTQKRSWSSPSLLSSIVQASLLAAFLCGGTVPVRADVPQLKVLPSLIPVDARCSDQVGCMVKVDGMTWNLPAITTYTWQSCNGSTCVLAKGNKGGSKSMSPYYILDHTDIGRTIQVKIQGQYISDLSKVHTVVGSFVVKAFEGTKGPYLQFINGLPDPSLSSSTSSIIEYMVTTDSAVSVNIVADGVVQPANFKQKTISGNNINRIQLKNLKPGPHTVRINAVSANGLSQEISYSWTTQAAPEPHPCTSCQWKPKVSETWDWQLQVPVNTGFVRDVYDIDGLLNNKQAVSGLKAKMGNDGLPRRVIGYFEAGTLSVWRTDAAQFPANILGNPYDPPYTDERWIDFRQLSAILPLMEKRLDQLVASGFDAVEFDNIDGWDIQQYRTSFPLTYEDGVAFTAALANLARSKGLRVSHKNNFVQVQDNLPYVDFAVSEQCFEYEMCDYLLPFIKAGKPVFAVEYKPYNAKNNVCSKARGYDIRMLYKQTALNSYGINCDASKAGGKRRMMRG